MKWLNLIKTAWSVGSSVPKLLSGGAGIWIRLGLVVAALSAAAGWGFVKGVEHGAGDRAQLMVDLERCQDGQGKLKAGITHQNGAIQALQADASRKRQEAAGAIRDAQAAKARAEGEAQRLRKLLHASGQKTGNCSEAVDQVRRGLR